MHRRRLLASGAALAAALAGCTDGTSSASDPDDPNPEDSPVEDDADPEAVVHAWYDALEDDDRDAVDALYHEESSLEIGPEAVGEYDLSVSVEDVSPTDDGDGRIVRTAVTTTDEDDASAGIHAVELRTDADGEWRVYDLDEVVEPGSPTQAEGTGTGSTEQIANNLNLIVASGKVGDDGDAIDEIRIGVGRAGNADDIDLQKVTVQYVSQNFFADLVHVEQGSGSPHGFQTVPILAEDESDDVLSSSSDRYEVVVPLGTDVPGPADNSELVPIQPSEEVELTFTTPAGAQTATTLRAPDSLASASPGDTVEL